jgi:hypothetical protein
MMSKKQLNLKLKKLSPTSQRRNLPKADKIKLHQVFRLMLIRIILSLLKHFKRMSKQKSLKKTSSNHSLKICFTRKRSRNSNQCLLKPKPNTVRTKLPLISGKLAKLCLSFLRNGTKPTIFSTSKKM